MRTSIIVTAALAFALTSGAALAQESGGDLPLSVKRIPMAYPTAHELANPDLYYPSYEPEYVVPPASLPAPPPAGIVRPGEFEPMDSVVITVINYGSAYFTMWRDMVDAYADSTHTYIIADSTTVANNLISLLNTADVPEDAYTILDYPVNTIWVRDYGPEFVREEDGTRHIVDHQYTGRPLDDVIPAAIGADDWINADGSPMAVHESEHGISGGNIVTDGQGTCFFSNIVYGYEAPSGWSDEEVDEVMLDYLGCEQIITLQPICHDGTGHIDLYAKLVGRRAMLLGEYPADTYFSGENPSNMSYGYCTNYAYPNDYQDQEDNLATIEATTNLAGEPWVVTRLPMLEPYWVDDYGGYWVYRSYMNSQIVNGVVAMPTYYELHGDETNDFLLDKEAEAIAAYEAAAPNGVDVYPIESDHIIPLAGAIHCITHEIPAEEDYEYTEPGDGDTDADSDADGGGDEDAGPEPSGSSDDGCGCSAAGAGAAGSLLPLIF